MEGFSQVGQKADYNCDYYQHNKCLPPISSVALIEQNYFAVLVQWLVVFVQMNCSIYAKVILWICTINANVLKGLFW